jgi:hypothetical protein
LNTVFFHFAGEEGDDLVVVSSSEGEEEEGESDAESEEESAEDEEEADPLAPNTSQPKRVRRNIKKGAKKLKSLFKAAKLPRPNKKKTLTKGPKEKVLKSRPAQEVESTNDETEKGREEEREVENVIDEVSEGKHDRGEEETEQESAEDASAPESKEGNGRVRESVSHLEHPKAAPSTKALTRAVHEPSGGGDAGGGDCGGSIDTGGGNGDGGDDEGGKSGHPMTVADDKGDRESALRPISNASPR